MYSLLAGFMEPGETVEAAVRREVHEESGITVGKVGYMTSQPWPFPSSLMIGCWGTATSTDIELDENELEDALWLSKEQIIESLSGNSDDILPARKGSIAQFLIENWVKDSIS
jgi:NAD+ diphosphatase